MPMRRDASRSSLLECIVRHPALPALLGTMESRALAGVIDRVGLADSAELMEIVPKPALLRALDESIWKSPGLGAAERLDRDEFVAWLEIWSDIGEEFLADRLEAMSDEYLAVLLASVLRVGVPETRSLDEEDDAGSRVELTETGEQFGPFFVSALFDDHADVLRSALLALSTHDSDRLLRLLAQLELRETMHDSSGRLASAEDDVRSERERFREAHGHVNAEDARAFLGHAASLSSEEIVEMSTYDHGTARHLAAMAADATARNPVEGIVEEEDDESSRSEEPSSSTEAVDDLHALLESAELIEPPAERALLTDKRETQQWMLEVELRALATEDLNAFEQRMREIVYLANVLMRGVSLRGSRLEERAAREAALAVSSLGLHVLRRGRSGAGLEAEPGLIRAFLAGWTMLQQIPSRVVEAFENVARGEAALAKKPWLREQVTIGIDDLRAAVSERRWADARDAAIFLSIAFDTQMCRTVGALLDDVPRLPLALAGVQSSAESKWIETISELETIASALAGIQLK